MKLIKNNTIIKKNKTKKIKKFVIQCLLVVIDIYQKFISPVIPARCRYYPTCSNYAKHALKWHGMSGIRLVVRRVLSCHPWGGCGVDFVPLPLTRFCYYYSPKAKTQGFGVFLNSNDYNAYRNRLFKNK